MTTGAKGINVSKMTQTKRMQLPVLGSHWREGRKGMRKEELHWDKKGPLASTRAKPLRRLSCHPTPATLLLLEGPGE